MAGYPFEMSSMVPETAVATTTGTCSGGVCKALRKPAISLISDSGHTMAWSTYWHNRGALQSVSCLLDQGNAGG